MAAYPPSGTPKTPPSAWVRLVASDFDGWWLGLTDDWAETLPCREDYLASYAPARRSPPLWVPSLCLTRIEEWVITPKGDGKP